MARLRLLLVGFGISACVAGCESISGISGYENVDDPAAPLPDVTDDTTESGSLETGGEDAAETTALADSDASDSVDSSVRSDADAADAPVPSDGNSMDAADASSIDAADAAPLKPNGVACGAKAECTSGNCVDGVCCNTACGVGEPNDCQACSAVAGGTAADGTCSPRASTVVCRAAAGACDVAEKCDGVAATCPADTKASVGTTCGVGSCSGSTAIAASTCNGVGVCQSGASTTCGFGCSGAFCAGDPCATVTCNTPPSTTCANASTRRTYASSGTCAGGTCSYAPTDTVCLSPPATTCANGTTLRTYASTGSCASGTCSYAPTDTACPSSGTCAAGVCAAPTGTPKSCQSAGDGRDNCGPSANESCCTSLPVAGIATATFSRSYDGMTTTCNGGAICTDPQYKAQVSDFKLDKYEITVGRFRTYVAAALGGWRPSAAAGKHAHLNSGAGLANGAGYEPGWDATWNTTTNFPVASTTWDANLNCTGGGTWSSAAGAIEKQPINCLTWYDAAAFCIWDGGFLPSEAEWNYAAAGGTEQRAFPWGSTVPAANTSLAIYGCYYNAASGCGGVANIAPVASVLAGNGKWGQTDLAGNVCEWTMDWHVSPYNETVCTNCSYLVTASYRVFRGGSFHWGTNDLLNGSRGNYPPSYRQNWQGARCARTP